MKKVLKLVKSRKSSSASSSHGGNNRSPGKGSLGQTSSSLGGESASATSVIYESQRRTGADGRSFQNQDNVASPSKSFNDGASISHIPVYQVSILELCYFYITSNYITEQMHCNY